MKTLFTVFLAALITCVNTLPLQAGTKGIQAVLLQGWSDQSVESLLSVVEVDAMKGKYFEVAFCPFLLNESQFPAHNDPKWVCKFWPTDPNNPKPVGCSASPQTVPQNTTLPRKRFDNTIMLIDRLLAKGVLVKLRVFLSFQASDSTSVETLKARAESINNTLFKAYADSVIFHFSPSLEDKYSGATAYTTQMNAIFSKLDYGKLSTRTHRPLRSIIPDNSQVRTPTTITVKNPSNTKELISLSVVHESHTTAYSSYNVWSNDGMYVYDSNSEDKDCTTNANNDFPTKYTILNFTKKADAFTRSTMLWRPAYNIFNRAKNVNGKRCYAKPALSDRWDDGKFDSNEISVLKQFLGLK